MKGEMNREGKKKKKREREREKGLRLCKKEHLSG
jgi:hypothetical protein